MISVEAGKRLLELSKNQIKKATPDWVAFFCCSAEFRGGCTPETTKRAA